MQNFLKFGETGMLDYPQLSYAVYRNFAFYSEVHVTGILRLSQT